MQSYNLVLSQSAATFTQSCKVDLGDLEKYSITVQFSGSNVAGTLTVEASDDNSLWVTIGGSAQTVISSTPHMYDVISSGYRYFRLVWAYTSGTGNISAVAYVKERTIKGA